VLALGAIWSQPVTQSWPASPLTGIPMVWRPRSDGKPCARGRPHNVLIERSAVRASCDHSEDCEGLTTKTGAIIVLIQPGPGLGNIAWARECVRTIAGNRCRYDRQPCLDRLCAGSVQSCPRGSRSKNSLRAAAKVGNLEGWLRPPLALPSSSESAPIASRICLSAALVQPFWCCVF
jgi:hypothetical protein